MVEMGMTLSLGQLVMDNEFVKMIRHVLRGMPVNDETLAVDSIKEVGPFKEFISHESTLKHMRKTSQPKLIDRNTREGWIENGSSDLSERAWEEARHIINTHKPDSIPEDIQMKMRSIVEETENELGIDKKRTMVSG